MLGHDESLEDPPRFVVQGGRQIADPGHGALRLLVGLSSLEACWLTFEAISSMQGVTVTIGHEWLDEGALLAAELVCCSLAVPYGTDCSFCLTAIFELWSHL